MFGCLPKIAQREILLKAAGKIVNLYQPDYYYFTQPEDREY